MKLLVKIFLVLALLSLLFSSERVCSAIDDAMSLLWGSSLAEKICNWSGN